MTHWRLISRAEFLRIRGAVTQQHPCPNGLVPLRSADGAIYSHPVHQTPWLRIVAAGEPGDEDDLHYVATHLESA